MAPPAKRRKRNIVAADEDDEDEKPQTNRNSLKNFLFSSPDSKAGANRAPSASPSPVKKPVRPSVLAQSSSNGSSNSLANLARQAKATTKSPSTSPEKKVKTQKKFSDEKGKSADLLTLFSKQAQRVQTDGPSSGTRKVDTCPLDDIISDPISEDDDIGVRNVTASSLVGKNAKKRFRESSQPAASSSAGASQRFLRPPKPTGPSAAIDDDQRPWSERFGPANLDELAVHKKKVADVRKWLEDVTNGQLRQRLLILKGAAGTGKTATMQLLAKDMGCEILEWRNPTGSLGATQGYSSASAQFEEFMGRGGKFGQLDFEDDSAPANTKHHGATDSGSTEDDKRRIILIEEFPNTFMRSGSALTAFRKSILHFLATNTPALATFGRQGLDEPIIPIVMIISETLLTTTSASADSFTAHRLLGPEILKHPGTGVIEFNNIAPTLLAKALELVVLKEARKSGRRRTPGPQVLRRLGEIGDIRNAISSLEFLCLKGDDDADWGSKVTFTKGKKASKDQALTKGEAESLELISQREASLGIFHAVGKVVYNKRDETPFPRGSEEAEAEVLPDYLAHYARPKRSQVSVDTLIDETGTDTATFISALHENYILSCEPSGRSDPQSSVDYINDCIEYLSESDLLNPSWDIFFGGKGFGSGFGNRDQGSHILRQDEMAFQVAVRGLLFSLPSPVKRMTLGSGGGKGGDSFKMFYPTSIKLWRAKEELEGLVDVWAAKMLKGEDLPITPLQSTTSLTQGASAFRKNKGSSVGDWAANKTELNYVRKPPPKPEAQEEEESAPLLSLGNSARKEMILERLPYMAHISRRRKGSFMSMGTRDLEKIVSFQGIGGPQTEESSDEADEGQDANGEAWATDKPTDESSPRKKRAAIRSRADQSEGSLVGDLHVHKLVLSDDDIEDD
ncbi:putative cell cycle checkpoint protein rad17 protein [Phaeoacremonium minimum UCRPA7]|uniref:Putative cell cycle checkpoint protein rad17 protein n=1 Tax=Phaeoacremonium minimum (strain UCR-PA7) TaxID=1286976 RepID=R8BES1_PHAM7|nr:putative cell cycle checkpoint protein rad17 protein [Phaeoacremonium minimum UCRPA7]EON97793.1 putative cell cycle checkpoint protein rad17 protein [Phaeoacremonium minimum UCRPA7]